MVFHDLSVSVLKIFFVLFFANFFLLYLLSLPNHCYDCFDYASSHLVLLTSFN
jgi:hypothetical protein